MCEFTLETKGVHHLSGQKGKRLRPQDVVFIFIWEDCFHTLKAADYADKCGSSRSCRPLPAENLESTPVLHEPDVFPQIFVSCPDLVIIGDESTAKEERRSCTVPELPTVRREVPREATKKGGASSLARRLNFSFGFQLGRNKYGLDHRGCISYKTRL